MADESRSLEPLFNSIEALLKALDPKSQLTAGLVGDVERQAREIGCKKALYIPGPKPETYKA